MSALSSALLFKKQKTELPNPFKRSAISLSECEIYKLTVVRLRLLHPPLLPPLSDSGASLMGLRYFTLETVSRGCCWQSFEACRDASRAEWSLPSQLVIVAKRERRGWLSLSLVPLFFSLSIFLIPLSFSRPSLGVARVQNKRLRWSPGPLSSTQWIDQAGPALTSALPWCGVAQIKADKCIATWDPGRF